MPPSLPSESNSISRAEWLWLAGAIFIGMVLRLSFPGRMAIEHFDEGVYASNFWFGADEGYEYPARHLYAPPLLPAAIEWTMIFAALIGVKPTGFIPMIPSLVAGIVTIPSIWWIGRRWFGPSAGIISGWLVATSDFHSSYSRAALTDVSVCLFILWGVYFVGQALQSGTRRSILLAGLFTGLAWWTKYNGWLPLAVGLAGGTAWQLSLPRSERQLKAIAIRGMAVVGLSFLIWSPVLVGLQKHGGYQAVAANHRQYVGRISGWGAAAVRQLVHAGLYDNWVGTPYEVYTADTVSKNLGLVIEQRHHKKQRTTVYDAPASMSFARTLSQENLDELTKLADVRGDPLMALVLDSTILPWILVLSTPLLLFGVAVFGCVARIASRAGATGNGVGWFLLAWIGGLSAATPFYHPYPRLILPWLMAVWLGAGLGIQMLVQTGRLGGTRPVIETRRWYGQWIEVLVVSCLFACGLIRCQTGTNHSWEDRSGLSRSADNLATLIKRRTSTLGFPGEESIVYVYGEPAIVFAMKASDLPLVGAAAGIGFSKEAQPRPTYFVWTSTGALDVDHFEILESVRQTQSHLVQFDRWDSFAAWKERRWSPMIELYRVK
ncbi:MAG: glycosyltransferase family 39 protein [Planctomycetes bacterium]|nr:glycosyltransferase family 39 protein [Planctomycetota bacterium]